MANQAGADDNGAGVKTVDDSVVVERARRGDRDAFVMIYGEHAPGTWRLALAVRPEPDAAGAAVAGAFGKILSPPHRRVPDRQAPVRLQLLAAARDAAVSDDPRGPRATHLAVAGTTRVEPSPSASGTGREHEALDTFERLPERWRSVLWLTEVEGLDLQETAAVIGLSVQNTAQLAARAHAGLREQFAQARVEAVTQPDCERTAARLGGYVTRSLSTRDAARVRRHLDACDPCRDRLDEIDDLPPRLRWAMPVLPAAVLGLAEAAWATSIDNATGPLGLTLPGGRPMPPWAERALAGATAAVVTIGITGAILAGGGGSRNRGPELAGTGTEQPIADGESALGSGQDGSMDGGLDDGGPPPSDERTGVAAATLPSTTTPTTANALPRSGSEPTAPVPAPSAPVTPVAPTAPDPVEPAEPAPESPTTTTPPLATIRVDDDTAVSVGGSCTGVEVLTIVVGCEPAGESTLPLLGL